jgi:uncharacterized protein (DUF2267 family)
MLTKPMPVRFEAELQALLQEGVRRTPHKKQELIRITLRRFLPRVIEEEAGKSKPQRLTNIAPWSKSTLENAYKKAGRVWDALEEAATKAQGKPDLDD